MPNDNQISNPPALLVSTDDEEQTRDAIDENSDIPSRPQRSLSNRLLHALKLDHKEGRTASIKGPNESSRQDPGAADENENARRSVAFKKHDRVVFIQRWKEYSDSVRGRLWMTADEMKINMKRNKREYAGEKKDWRNAVEEEQMPVCPKTGERIHPVHFLRVRSQRRIPRRTTGKATSTAMAA